MILRELRLSNFRNFKRTQVNFSNLVIFFGGNASGKTNLLEAIYFLAYTFSFREKDSSFLIKYNENFSHLWGLVENQKEMALEVFLVKKNNSVEKKVKVKSLQKKLSDFLGNLNVVLFSPTDLDLILGPPTLRRRYFNLVISQIDSRYRGNLLKFRSLLKARNKLLFLLSQGKGKISELDFWNSKLVELGSFLILKRKKALEFFKKWCPVAYEALTSEKKDFEVEYKPQIKGESLEEIQKDFKRNLQKSQEQEIKWGFSIVGPHRDEFLFTLGGKLAASEASRGEIRTAVVALKFIELKFLEEGGKRPILLLDDVFSELDEVRRDFLCRLFGRQQTIVTTTDLDHIKPSFRKGAKIIKIEDGKLIEI